MESAILDIATNAIKQPGVTGYLCVDKDGLCLAAKGQASQSMSGIVHQLASLASKIEEPSPAIKDSPVIRVELECYKILIQSRDPITVALISPQK